MEDGKQIQKRLNFSVQKGNYSDAECANRCFRDCRQIRYEIDHEVQGRMVRPGTQVYTYNAMKRKLSKPYLKNSILQSKISLWRAIAIKITLDNVSLQTF